MLLANGKVYVYHKMESNLTSELRMMTPWLFGNVTKSENMSHDFRLQCSGNSHPLDFVPALIYVVILFIVGVPGNILVCYVYSRKWRTSKKSYTLFILYLAILDLLNCIITLPFEMVLLQKAFDFDEPLACKLFRTLTYCINVLSGVTHLGIGFDRLLGIRYWSRLKQIGVFHVKLSFVLGCVFALLTCWPTPVLYDTEVHDLSSSVTLKTCSFSGDQPKFVFGYVIYLLSSNIIVDCILIAQYSLIGLFVYRQNKDYHSIFAQNTRHLSKTEQDAITSHYSVRRESKDSTETLRLRDSNEIGRTLHGECSLRFGHHYRTRKTTLLLFVITLVYILTFIPLCVVFIRRCLGIDRTQDFLCNSVGYRNTMTIVKRSYLLGMAADPLVYCFMSTHFRKECKQLFERSSSLFKSKRKRDFAVSIHYKHTVEK